MSTEAPDFCRAMLANVQGCIDQIAREAVAACTAGPTRQNKAQAMDTFVAKYKAEKPVVILAVDGTPVTPMERVAEYIHMEMLVNYNSHVVVELARLNKDIMNRSVAYEVWKAMVGGGRDWDHKNEILKNFMDWSYDVSTQHLFAYDIWSNVHYGYVGLPAGFGEDELQLGAGVANVISNGPKYIFPELSLDDPKDTNAITLGMELWKAHGPTLTLEDLVYAIRQNCEQLNTYHCRCGPCL